MEKMTIDKKMSVAIYRSALVQTGGFMGLSAQEILDINNRLGGKLEGIGKNDLHAMANVCKNSYDLFKSEILYGIMYDHPFGRCYG